MAIFFAALLLLLGISQVAAAPPPPGPPSMRPPTPPPPPPTPPPPWNSTSCYNATHSASCECKPCPTPTSLHCSFVSFCDPTKKGAVTNEPTGYSCCVKTGDTYLPTYLQVCDGGPGVRKPCRAISQSAISANARPQTAATTPSTCKLYANAPTLAARGTAIQLPSSSDHGGAVDVDVDTTMGAGGGCWTWDLTALATHSWNVSTSTCPQDCNVYTVSNPCGIADRTICGAKVRGSSAVDTDTSIYAAAPW